MKRVIYIATILCVLLSVADRVVAQHVALKERIPKIKTDLWLDDREPKKAQYTYIEFVHSKTSSCIRTFRQIQEDKAYFGENMRAIIITKESPEQISSALRECVNEYIHVAFDAEGDVFNLFGVKYVPFGIIIDHRRKALWFGNPATVNEDFFSKITTQNNDTH